jgi:mannosyltransferase
MRRHLPLTGIVVLAALLRLVGLGSRSLWLDEGAEYDAVHGSLGHLFERIANRESTPPLSYLYEWGSTKVIGTSEFALRLPFALVGIALVFVVYDATRLLAGRRAGLFAAALVACNPMLVWHSQDARSYILLALLVAGTIDALVRRRLWWWAVLAAAALGTHYFAVFIVLPEAAWLLRGSGGRAAWRFVAVPAVTAIPLAVLASSQTGARQAWIEGISFITRFVQVPAGMLEGYQLARDVGAAVGLVVVAAVIPPLLAAWRDAAGRTMLALGAIAIALPVAAALTGQDYIVQRNMIGALIAFMIAAAIGFDRLRHGVALAVGLCAIWIGITVATADDPKYRREDWRSAARATRVAEATLLVPRSGKAVMSYYRHGIERVDSGRVTSLAVVRMGQTTGTGCRIPDAPALPPTPTFGVRRGTCWEVDLRRWATPRLITAGDETLVR